MGAEIKNTSIVQLGEGMRASLQVNRVQVALGVIPRDIIIKAVKGKLMVVEGLSTLKKRPPEIYGAVLFRGKVYSADENTKQIIEIGDGEKFVAITDEGFIRKYKGLDEGFVTVNENYDEDPVKPGDVIDTAGVAVRATSGEYR